MTPEERRRAVEAVAVEFERKHGATVLLKLCFSAMNRALVESEAVPEYVLHRCFLQQAKTFQQQVKDAGDDSE